MTCWTFRMKLQKNIGLPESCPEKLAFPISFKLSVWKWEIVAFQDLGSHRLSQDLVHQWVRLSPKASNFAHCFDRY